MTDKSWFLNGNRLRFRCSHAHEPFYPKDPLPDRIFLPYGSLKSECLNRMIFFGEASLRRALREFGEHFHHERNQGLANRSIDAGDEVGRKDGE